jgi:hypothetical protein
VALFRLDGGTPPTPDLVPEFAAGVPFFRLDGGTPLAPDLVPEFAAGVPFFRLDGGTPLALDLVLGPPDAASAAREAAVTKRRVETRSLQYVHLLIIHPFSEGRKRTHPPKSLIWSK